MGGVPVLMITAAMGIGYGWSPDGSGGVEYVVQIPPDQVEQIQRAGEISSVIPPEVRGSVSRVVVRISDEAPPQETPPALSQRVNRAPGESWADPNAAVESQALMEQDRRSAVPIPALGSSTEARPIRFRDDSTNVETQSGAAMKPDPQTGGSGLQLPSLRQTAQEMADRAGQKLEGYAGRADQEIANATNQLRRKADEAINSLTERSAEQGSNNATSSNQLALPGFAGQTATNNASSQGAGSIRSSIGVRTSEGLGSGRQAAADPSRGTVSDAYGNMRGAQVGTRPGGPSTDPVSSSSSSGSSTPIAGSLRDAGGWRGNVSSAAGNRSLAEQNAVNPQPRAPQQPGSQANSSQPGSNLSSSTPQSGQRNTFNQPQIPDGYPYTDQVAPYPPRNFGEAPRGYGNESVTGSQMNAGSQTSGEPAVAGQSERQRGAEYQRDVGLGPHFGRAPVDPDVASRLDWQRQREWREQSSPAGDVWEDPRGRLGRQPRNEVVSHRDREQRDRQYAAVARRDEATDTAEQGSSAPSPSDVATNPPSVPPSVVKSANQDQAGPPNLGTSSPNAVVTERRPSEASRSVAAQPLFNGLLLFSFVANLYLVFWLKNLRHQFRELVAAKRASSTSSVAAYE